MKEELLRQILLDCATPEVQDDPVLDYQSYMSVDAIVISIMNAYEK